MTDRPAGQESGQSRGLAFRGEELRKIYRTGETEVHALRGVDLAIPAGEMLVLLGPSGSGKSTLLNIIGGLDRATSGRLFYGDTDLTALDDKALTRFRRAEVGFIFQFYNLMPVLNAFENVELPLLLTGLSRAERRARVEMTLALVGLADRMDHRPNELSGGQQQRVAIARAIVSDPLLLIADEPTGDLDRTSAAEILALLRRLNEELGKTIVMVTHDPRAAEAARHLIYLDKGQLTDTSPFAAGAH